MDSGILPVRWHAGIPEVCALADGRPALIRPLVPGDAPLLQDFVRRLSPDARRMRFQTGFAELYPALLQRLVRVDQHTHAALVATLSTDRGRTLIGEARYAPSMEIAGAFEFAVAVADEFQRSGLGSALIRALLRHARRSGVAHIHGDVLQDNTGMLALARKLGFETRRHPDGAWLARVVLDLGEAPDLPGPGSDQPTAATFGRPVAAGSSSALISA